MRARFIVVLIVLLAGAAAGPGNQIQASDECLSVVLRGRDTYTYAAAHCTTVSGGQNNWTYDHWATVSGGAFNRAGGEYATIGGGGYNQTLANFATIGGGGFTNSADPDASTNRVTDSYGTISGGGNNGAGNGEASTFDQPFATVGGGNSNTASSAYTTVGGGTENAALNTYASVGGGYSNQASGISATIAGGYDNTVGETDSTISGGASNTVTGYRSVIGGGVSNTISAAGATIAGGEANRAADDYASVGGGRNNQAGDNAGTTTNRSYATVAGGYVNIASGGYASIGGGRQNTASGIYATTAGGYANVASGGYSFAAGRQARASQTGSFVWGDSQIGPVSATAPNQFVVRASGGIWLGTTSTVAAPNASKFINTSTGAFLSNGGAWTNSSDRNVKANFAAVDSRSILEQVAAMPIQSWNYKSQDASVKHIGPMAQDFAAAFGVGEDDRHISTVDADGVALAAIQGLNQKVNERDARIARLEQENTKLQKRMAALEAMYQNASTPVQVTAATVALDWLALSLGVGTLIALLVVSSVSLTLLFLRRRTTV